VETRTSEKGNEVENLKRVDALARAKASVTGPSDTPQNRRRAEYRSLRREVKGAEPKFMGGGQVATSVPGLTPVGP
jgi:hypothetical protein